MIAGLPGFSAPTWLQELPPGIPQGPPPLPGGVAAVVRWFFHVPQWIQMVGGALAALTAVGLAWFLWRRRRAIWTWLSTRAVPLQAGLALTAALSIVIFAGAARVSWNYMMHDNDFCTACHVMGSAFQRFSDSEHAELNCHDCHNQSIFASARQMHLWIVERPEEIGEHAPVPTRTCNECHSTGRDSTWQRVLETAGHRTHLESDSAALADVMCVTCHGQEVHRFIPATQTCGQADCHAEEDTRIVLGAMTEVTSFHCISCHEFTRPVGALVSTDSARAALSPAHPQCVSCHEMSELLEPFDAEEEPHGATCGSCHDPHAQRTPEAALVSCATGGCHAGVDTLSAFHRGLEATTLDACLSCHEAHTWRVEGSACLDCHADVLAPRGGQRGIATGRLGPAAGPVGLWTGIGAVPPRGLALHVDRPMSARQAAPPFDHLEHAELECVDCHSSERRHGEIMVRTAAQCASCHHQGGGVERCETCHDAPELEGLEPPTRSVTMVVANRSLDRELGFRHAAHTLAACADCHTPSAGGAFAPPSACASCHVEHHAPEARCSACHAEPPPPEAHDIAVHTSPTCSGSGCHVREGLSPMATVERYAPITSPREACLACHAGLVEHEPAGDCASCHLVPPRDRGGDEW